jgi:pre-mRNA cleavage complex 2 protein Pcf11
MDAYTLVEPPVRRKFEELLLTWKEPPSTGLTTTPVFPLDVTRKIETALLKAKTLALQLEQRRQREMVAAGLVQHRNTPPMSFLNNQPEWNGNTVRAIDHSYSMAHSLQNMVNVYPTTSPSNQDILLGEIKNMLTIVTRTLLLNPADEAARTQATALNQLQSILQTSALPYDQIESVRQQLAALPIQQRPQRETATPPIPDLMQQDRNTESLFQSLRAAGLLRAETTATPIPPLPTVRPLAINANAANLRISDLELTSVSLQK